MFTTKPAREWLERWIASGNTPWPERRTYHPIELSLLPPLPPRSEDPLEWLRAAPLVGKGICVDGAYSGSGLLERLSALEAEAASLGLRVPEVLVMLLRDPSLQRRIPSGTGCSVELPPRLLVPPGGLPGRLLRFLGDGQGSMYWFAHLLPEGAHRVVATCGDLREDEALGELDGELLFEMAWVCAPDMGTFLQRFWLENACFFRRIIPALATPDVLAYATAVEASLAAVQGGNPRRAPTSR